MEKIVTVVLMLGMMGGISINTVAAGENQTEVLQVDERGSEISIMMVNITKQENKLMISGSHDATVKCCLIGLRGVTKTSITATLQKKLEIHGQMLKHGQQQQIPIKPVLQKQKMLLLAVLIG